MAIYDQAYYRVNIYIGILGFKSWCGKTWILMINKIYFLYQWGGLRAEGSKISTKTFCRKNMLWLAKICHMPYTIPNWNWSLLEFWGYTNIGKNPKLSGERKRRNILLSIIRQEKPWFLVLFIIEHWNSNWLCFTTVTRRTEEKKNKNHTKIYYRGICPYNNYPFDNCLFK